MKNILYIFILMLLLIVFVWNSPQVFEPSLKEEKTSFVPFKNKPKRSLSSKPNIAPAAQEEQPKLFPGAKLLSSTMEYPEENKELIIETLQTNKGIVRVEKTVSVDPDTKKKVVLGEVAMMANHVLLEHTETIPEDKFLDILSRAGAVEVKDLGDAYLAIFEQRPENPNATMENMERIRLLSDGLVVVEPNYIRRLL